VTIHSCADAPAGDQAWIRNAHGAVAPADGGSPADLTVWPVPGAAPAAQHPAVLYAGLAAKGLHYGPAFRGVQAVWRRGDEVFAEVLLPGDRRGGPGAYAVHPALLDAALHAIALGGLVEDDSGGMLPYAWNDVRILGDAGSALRVLLAPAGRNAVSVDVADPTGRPVASIGSLALRPAPGTSADSTPDGPPLPARAP